MSGNTAKQGAIVLFDQGFLSIANFITGVLVARACSKEEYGTYVLAWSLLLIFSSVLRAIVQVPFTVYLPRLDKNKQDVYQGSALIHTLVLGIVFTLLIISAPAFPFMQYGQLEELVTISTILSILIIPFLLREFIRSALFARLNFFASLAANAAATTIQLAAIVTLYSTNKLQLTNAFESILASSIFATTLMLWSHRKMIVIKSKSILTDLARGWGISKWVLLNAGGLIGVSQAFPWLLLSLVDAEAVAVYGAAMAVSTVVSPLLRAVNSYVLPRMAHGFREGDTSTLNRMLKRSILVMAVPYGAWTIIGSIYSEGIMTLLYSSEYSGYGLTVVLLLVKNMIESVSAPLTSTLLTLERPEITTKALFMGTISTLSLGPLAIMEYSVNGAAAAAIISSTIVSLYKYMKIKTLMQGST